MRLISAFIFSLTVFLYTNIYADNPVRERLLESAKVVETVTTRSGETLKLLLYQDSRYPNLLQMINTTTRNGKSTTRSSEMVADHMLVKLNDKATKNDLVQLNKKYGFTIAREIRGAANLFVVKFSSFDTRTLSKAITDYSNESIVNYAEPDFLLYSESTTPNAPYYYDLWGMKRIQADVAWDGGAGSSQVVVAVLDSGVNYQHPDLASNMWTNTGEIPDNGIDDDNNGYIDDYYGFDFYNNDGDPMDDLGHGSHCSGIIGAVGNNGKGVVGVNWTTKIMALKMISKHDFSYNSVLLEAIYYSTNMNASLTSNSYGGFAESNAVREAIEDAMSKNKLYVNSAGNSGLDIDTHPAYPKSYDLPNMVIVAATDIYDKIAYFSNYGRNLVDLAAPGVNILSTTLGENYESYDGTSMACPCVAGACALLLSREPGLGFLEIKERLNNGVDKLDSLSGLCVSEGRLNVNKLLNGYINLTAPNGSDVLIPNQAVTITWNSHPSTGTVKIELLKGGSAVATIAENATNNGTYSWTPDASLSSSDDYAIKLTLSTNNAARSFWSTTEDESDTPFSIASSANTLTIDASPEAARPTDLPKTLTVGAGIATTVAATDKTGYQFTNWSALPSENATFADSAASVTAVTTSGDVTVYANYQTVVPAFSEDFTNMTTFPPDGWTVSNSQTATGYYPHWEATNMGVVCGAGYNQNEWLKSPTIDLPNDGTPYLHFEWFGLNYNIENAYFIVRVSVDGGSNWTPIWNWSKIGTWESGANETTLSLSDYAGRSIRLAFQFLSVNDDESSLVALNAIRVENKEKSPVTTLEFYSAPEIAGTTTPAAVYYAAIGETMDIQATPIDGYEFVAWQIFGDAYIADAFSTTTQLSPYTATTVYALFTPTGEKTSVYLKINKATGGVSSPSNEVVLDQGSAYKLSAVPNSYYRFVEWQTVSGKVTYSNRKSADTTIVLPSGNAVIKPVFAQLTGIMTITSVPALGGTVSPSGKQSLGQGKSVELAATPNTNYSFMGWLISGDTYYPQINDGYYDVSLLGSSATFKGVFANSMVLEGFDDASAWTIKKYASGNTWIIVDALGSTYEKVAYCESGEDVNTALITPTLDLSQIATPTLSFAWQLVNYSTTGGLYVKISDDGGATWSDPVTVMTFNDTALSSHTPYLTTLDIADYAGKSQVNIAFQLITQTCGEFFLADVKIGGLANGATLTMAVSPEGSGTTSPTASTIVGKGETYTVTATPNEGYYFVAWSGAENIKIANQFATTTQVTLSGDAVLTALFSAEEVELFAKGMVIPITAETAGLEAFTQKPKVSATFDTPVSNRPRAVGLNVVTTVSKRFPATSVNAEWRSKVKLYDTQSYNLLGMKLSQQLLDSPIQAMKLNQVTMESREISGVINVPGAFYFVPPVITSASTSSNTMTIKGKYFGTTAPRIFLEYQKKDSFKKRWFYRRCPLNKSLSNRFPTAKGGATNSCMKVLEDGTDYEIGYSEISVKLPDFMDIGTLSGYLILDNGYAFATYYFGDY